MGSNAYILRFTLIMTVVSSLALAGMFYATKPASDRNEVVFNKRAILSAVSSHLEKDLGEMSDQEVLQVFDEQIEQIVINSQGEEVEGQLAESVNLAQERKKPESERQYPIFVFKSKEGNQYYILSVRGNGLWDEIWGNIALEGDLNTIAGVSFDHKAETPGLGAEIKDSPAFQAQFLNKKIMDESGNFVSVLVRKGGAQDEMHEVDGISGATITSNGVTEMIRRGLNVYLPYLKKQQPASSATGMK